MSEEFYKKWHDRITKIEDKHGDRIGFVVRQWLGRLVRGLAPKEDKAPWWVRLEGEHLINTINGVIAALEFDKKSVDKVIAEFKKMLKEI